MHKKQSYLEYPPQVGDRAKSHSSLWCILSDVRGMPVFLSQNWLMAYRRFGYTKKKKKIASN